MSCVCVQAGHMNNASSSAHQTAADDDKENTYAGGPSTGSNLQDVSVGRASCSLWPALAHTIVSLRGTICV